MTPGRTLAGSWDLEEALRRTDTNGKAARFRLVKDAKEAKLEVAMDDSLAVLKVLDQKLEKFGLTDISFKTSLDRLVYALGAAAHYYWYLDLTKENDFIDTIDGVTVDFYLLQETESEFDSYGLPFLVPVEPGFCRRDRNAETSNVIDFVVDPNELYGIKITNNTTQDLYLNAFLFNNISLGIGE